MTQKLYPRKMKAYVYKELYKNVHNNFVNNQNLKTAQMFINRSTENKKPSCGIVT